MGKVSEAQRRAVAKYNAGHYDRLEIKVQRETMSKASLQTHAAAQGESLNAFVNRAIRETVERDKARNGTP